MPHLIIEHSAELADRYDLQQVVDALFAGLTAHAAITRPEALKIRMLACTAHRLGTEPQSFAHATLLLLPGRGADTKSDLTACILRVLEDKLGDVGSLSVNLADLDAAYAKRVL